MDSTSYLFQFSGGMIATSFLSFTTWSVIGIMTFMLLEFVFRKKKDTEPSFAYYWQRNWLRMLLSVVLSMTLIVLGPKLIDYIFGVNIPIENWSCWLIGLISDKIATYIKKIKSFKK